MSTAQGTIPLGPALKLVGCHLITAPGLDRSSGGGFPSEAIEIRSRYFGWALPLVEALGVVIPILALGLAGPRTPGIPAPPEADELSEPPPQPAIGAASAATRRQQIDRFKFI